MPVLEGKATYSPEDYYQQVASDPDFEGLSIADKVGYLQNDVLPLFDNDFKQLGATQQREYIGQHVLPYIKQIQTQRAFSGQFSKPEGPDQFQQALKPNSDYEFSTFSPAGMMIPVPRGTNQGTGRAILESLKGASLGYADLTNAIPDPFKTPESQGLYEAARMAGEFAPFSAVDSLIARGALAGVGLGTKMLRGAASMGAVEAARKREGQDQIDPLGRLQSAGEGALYGAAIPVAEKALGSILKLFGRTKGNPLRLISKEKIHGPRVRGLEDALMQEPVAYRTKKGLVTKEQKGLQQLGGMTQQRVNQAANATGLTKADAMANRRRAISKLYDDMTALSQHPQASPKQRAFAEKAAKAIKDRYERAQITKERAAIQEKYRAKVAASRVRKAVSDLTTDKVPVNERRAIREKFQQKAQEQNARERLLEKLNARKEADAAKATAKTEAEAARQQRRIERQKELEAKANKSAQEKIELENLKQKNRLTLEEQKYRNRKALLEQKGQPAKPAKAQPAKPAPKPEAPQRETLYEGKATHNAKPVPKEDTLPGLKELQGHVEVQRRPDLIEALNESYQKTEFVKPKYNAEIVGQELDKLPGKGIVPYQLSAAKNGTVMIRVIDHEGQFRTIKLFDGKGGSALDSVRATGEKAPFQLASDVEDLTRTGTPRQRVLNTDTGAIEPIYKSGEAIKTSELQVHEEVLRNARDVLARAEAGKATPREIIQASKAVTDQDIERTLGKMTPEQRKKLLKEITGKDCQ